MASRHSVWDSVGDGRWGRPRRRSRGGAFWLLLILAVGALGGIALASRYLHAQDRQAEDPDAPLFI